jgi:hypothetical protein
VAIIRSAFVTPLLATYAPLDSGAYARPVELAGAAVQGEAVHLAILLVEDHSEARCINAKLGIGDRAHQGAGPGRPARW